MGPMLIVRFKSLFSRSNLAKLVVIAVAIVVLAGASVYAAVVVWPGIGAQTVEVLRGLVGEKVVASFEDFVFQIQDTAERLQYDISGVQPSAPWAAAAATPAARPQALHPLPTATTISMPTATPEPVIDSAGLASERSISPLPMPGPTVTPPPWIPDPVSQLGSLPEEGQWSAYISRADTGAPVAYRTFLQPDASRPYAVVSVVAFDLDATRLNFVLGSEEPKASFPVKRSGKIPDGDLQPGRILAAFNGGFKAEHGQFGAMVNGVNILPPRYGFGTVAAHTDGQVKMGAWGTDITRTSDIVWWRQNGPLLIHDGVINPHTADNSPEDWGYTVKGGTATWRSALGISADGRTLYYAVGPSLTLPALTQAMVATGADQAIQLDINPYWTHFDSFPVQDGQLTAVPLLDAMHGKADDRYLKGFSRDFFYVTTAP
jgi:hypothetical protein